MSDSVDFLELITPLDAAKALGEDRTGRMVGAMVGVIKSAVESGKEAAVKGLGSFRPVGADGGAADTSDKANLLGDVCAKIHEAGDSRVEAVFKESVDAVTKQLLDGRKVNIPELGSFSVHSERPEIERQPKGHRLIKAAVATLTFAPEDGLKIAFVADDTLKQKVEAFKESSIMLVVPEKEFFVDTLVYYFESAGWEVDVFTEVVDALQRIESGKAYLTVLDASMPDWQKFCYSLKVRRETTNVPLIVMYPNEDAFNKVQDVVIVGDDNLAQPFEFRQIMDVADGEIMRAAEEELVFLQQVNLHLPTDEPSIEKVIDWVHKALERSGIGEEGQVAMSAAFREAVVNAAQHGNKYKRDRKIQVQYLLDEEKITAIVRDQGGGFDHSQYVKSGSTRDALSAARERHQQGRMGGLGIMLMLRCCDRLEYNKAGNQISLTKYLKSPED